MDEHGIAITARALVSARRSAVNVTGFPGTIPDSLAQAYLIQDAAIELRDERVAGWKVGLIAPHWEDVAGAGRLVGPIFADRVWHAEAGRTTPLPAIPGGTTCVEAEIVMTLARDLGPGEAPRSIEEATTHLGAVHVAIELAGSPVPDINGLGPMAVAADFGNNAGLVLGPEVPDWRSGTWRDLECETWIDGELVGDGRPSTTHGGAIEAFRFALATCTDRGMTLRAGDHIATGAVTGIHDAVAGQGARVRFGDLFQFDLAVVEA